MRWSQTLIPTLKENPAEAEATSHKLMIRAGLIRKLASGFYSYLPAGLKVLQKIKRIVREEMNAADACEVLLPALHPPELWKQTRRYELLGGDMYKLIDRNGKEFVLGPTHEEIITALVAGEVKSYKDLPLILYQIQTKFRDEPRPRFGVIRSREFIMKDAYSFDKDNEGLELSYKKMYSAYCNIFSRCGLNYLAVEADPGFMGGNVSHEFMVLAEAGEDVVVLCKSCGYAATKDADASGSCPKCSKEVSSESAIEIGHVFKLGTKYSEPLGAKFLDEKGVQRPIIMGCYGVGVNRIIAAAIEQNHDADGIIWPASIAPFEILVLVTNSQDELLRNAGRAIYEQLKRQGKDVLLDDRDLRAGVKFKDADLLGIPTVVIVGEKYKEHAQAEVRDRRTKNITMQCFSETSV